MRRNERQVRVACVVGLLVTLAGCSSATGSETVSTGSSSPDRSTLTDTLATFDRVVLIGDSLAVQTAPYLQQMIGDRPFDLRAFGGTAPCDWLGQDLAATSSSLAIISFVGNADSACMADNAGSSPRGQALVDRYRSDVTALVAQVRSTGASVLLVGQPEWLGDEENAVELAGLNELYESLVEPGVVEFVDAGAAVEDASGAFALRLPCMAGEQQCDPDGSIAVRSDDGVHFCTVADAEGCVDYSSGAFRFAGAIASVLDLE